MAHHAADPNQDHDFEVIDLSPFFTTPGAGDGDDLVVAKEKEEAIRRIREACSDSGMFLIVNHGVPAEALDETLAVAREFFAGPDEEKLKWSPRPPEPGAAATMPMGYVNQAAMEFARNNSEVFRMGPTGSGSTVYPTDPTRFREVMERTFEYFVKTVAPLIETLINDALGLPPDLLRQYNSERQWDVMLAYHYFKATETKKVGSHPHKDPNLFTVLLQDDVGGLEFLRGDGEWIPVSPVPHSLIVNVGDVVQVR
ncbi:unnamed protein product [Linum tenue]|uniref:Fe2OG dioxygenase domain-containing protein n=1 Tax=Linum tenue TaxID=586396 RepID=A0AAV0M8Q1_9ROSI|nr:unnamed protein product [Linum tenue]